MTTRRQHSPSGGGVLPIMAYAPGEAPPERVFFFFFRQWGIMHERVGFYSLKYMKG